MDDTRVASPDPRFPPDFLILIGGLGAIDPERKALIARLAVRAVVSGLLACFMTACYAGMLV